MKNIRVMVVDDHPVVRSGVIGLINGEPDMELVAEAVDGLDAVEQFATAKPDVCLMDVQMPNLDGIEAITRIKSRFPDARVIVLTMNQGDVAAARALRAGAAGYLVKSSLRHDLIKAIRAVDAGRRYVPVDLAMEIAIHVGDDTLSEKETRVLELVAGGMANREIGERLSMSEDTVKGHMKKILSKLGAQDRAQAVALGIKRGFISV